jgi:hypothetical protein
MIFAELPLDPLTAIFNYLDAYEIGYMWFCGSKTLNWKLSTGGAAKRFKLDSWRHLSVSWPKLISQLPHLEILDVYISPYTGSFPDVELDFLKVPESLKHLELSLPWALHYLKLALGANPRLFPNLEALHISRSYHDDVNTWYLMPGSIWPKLTSLSLSDSSWPIQQLDVSSLPPQLTYLEYKAISLNFDGGGFPETLVHLDLCLANQTDIFALLPAGLTAFIIYFDNGADQVHRFDWSKLPRGLLELQLDCPHFSVENATQLPPNLTSIRVSNHMNNDEQLYEIVKVLPRTLTSIRSLLPDPLNLRFVAVLPPNMRQPFHEDTEEDAVPHLPASAEKVRLTERSPPRAPKVVAFPPNTKTVSTPLIDEALASVLPDKVTHLTVNDGQFTVECLKKLPNGILSLMCIQERPLESSHCLKYLPPIAQNIDLLSIDHLTIGEMLAMAIVAPPQSASWFSRCVTDLSIGPIVLSKGQCIHTTGQGPFEADEDVPAGIHPNAPADCTCFFSHLPPLLRTLKLYVAHLPKDAFTQLSCEKTLESIEIRMHGPPTAGLHHFVTTMPPRLQRFYWNAIEEIEIEQNDIRDETLINLPKRLFVLDLPASPVTEACAPHLPPFIAEFTLANRTPPWFETLRKSRMQAWASQHQLPQRRYDDDNYDDDDE